MVTKYKVLSSLLHIVYQWFLYVGVVLNLQKLHYQYLTISVAVVLVVRWYFNG